MSGFSTPVDNAILDSAFRGQPWAVGQTRYLALFSAATGLTDNVPANFKEVPLNVDVAGVSTATAYTRIAHTNASMDPAEDSQIINNVVYTFPIALADWGTVSHLAIMDSATHGAGNVIAWGMFRNPITLEPQPRVVYAYDQLTLRDGSLVIKLEDNAAI